jgi:hypothetical protein
MSFNWKTPSVRCAFSLVAVALCITSVRAAVIEPGQQNVRIRDIAFDPMAVDSKERDLPISIPGVGSFNIHVIDVVFSVDGLLGFGTQVRIDIPPPGDPQLPADFKLDRILRTNYAGFSTDARPQPDVGGFFSPATASRSPFPGSPFPGSTVQFNFLEHDPLNPNIVDMRIAPGVGGSSFFVILTNATRYAEVGQLQAGSGDLLFGPLSVFSPIPEPGQWAMLLAGLGLLVTVIRRRLH